MNDKSIIVGLDVGTTKVCTIVGSKNNSGEIEIIGIGCRVIEIHQLTTIRLCAFSSTA